VTAVCSCHIWPNVNICWPTGHVTQVDPRLDFEKAWEAVPGFQFPSLGQFHPAEYLKPPEAPEGEGTDPVLDLVKLESAPSVPLTLKRKRDLQNARNHPAAKNLKSVASRLGVVDLTNEEPDEEDTSAQMATASTSTTAQ
jgi:hypothetical protein